MKIENPYHEGELQVQERVGVLGEGVQNARVIQDSIIKGALRFLNQLPMAVLGSVDPEGQVWASVCVGYQGFMEAEDERTLKFDLSKIFSNIEDPFWQNIKENPQVGMLAIELASRRRLRINGKVSRNSETQLTLHVEESYPNCPKYIQKRHLITTPGNGQSTEPSAQKGSTLSPDHRARIERADTFFVASVHPDRGVDASHRGGTPGFVRFLDEHTLRVPDYPGNSMFNTFGNFTMNPRGGLVFLDFESNQVLQLTGEANILYDVEGSDDVTGGTNRFLEFRVSQWIETSLPHTWAWEYLDASPYNPSSSKHLE